MEPVKRPVPKNQERDDWPLESKCQGKGIQAQMATVPIVTSTAEFPRQNLNFAVIVFFCLQALDLLSTLLVFAHGGVELNPVVRAFMPFVGKLMAVLLSKAVLVTVIWMFARRRKRVLLLADALYTGVVIWNFSILAALASSPHTLL